MSNSRRFRVLADLPLQGGLCLRLAFYWFFAQLTFAAAIGLAVTLNRFSAGGDTADVTSPELLSRAFLLAALALPLPILDMLFYSNRFAGPLRRFRTSLHRLAAGEEPAPLHFREKDHLQELGRDFNTIRERLQQINAAAPETARRTAADAYRTPQPIEIEPGPLSRSRAATSAIPGEEAGVSSSS